MRGRVSDEARRATRKKRKETNLVVRLGHRSSELELHLLDDGGDDSGNLEVGEGLSGAKEEMNEGQSS